VTHEECHRSPFLKIFNFSFLYPDMKKNHFSSQIFLKLTFSHSEKLFVFKYCFIFIVLGPDTSTPGSREGKHRGDKDSNGGQCLTKQFSCHHHIKNHFSSQIFLKLTFSDSVQSHD
jgi:hypothetical protein